MLSRRRPPHDFADEIRSHLELETQRLIEEGLSGVLEVDVVARRLMEALRRAIGRVQDPRSAVGGNPWHAAIRNPAVNPVRSAHATVADICED